jgi:hypothetical protein
MENDRQIKCVRSDCGREYNGLKKYLGEEAILLEVSAGSCPEINRTAAGYNRTINDKVQSILSRACLTYEMRSDAPIMRIIFVGESRSEHQMA